MRVNLISTLLALPLAYLGGSHFSSAGVVLALMGVAVCVTLPFAVIVWLAEIDNVARLATSKE